MHDFHDYLDLARVFWALDDERIEAISQSETAARAFRSLARYILELKAEMEKGESTDRESEIAAITKVAIRLAGVPEEELVGALSGLPARPPAASRRKGWWRMLAGLIALLLVGLLTSAALAAAGVDLPAPIKAVLESVSLPSALEPNDLQERAPASVAVPPTTQVPPAADAPRSLAAGLKSSGKDTDSGPADPPRDEKAARRAEPETRRRMGADPHGGSRWAGAIVQRQRRPGSPSETKRTKAEKRN